MKCEVVADLMITIPHRVDNAALLSTRISSRLERTLGGCRVDVILVIPDTIGQPKYLIAGEPGVKL